MNSNQPRHLSSTGPLPAKPRAPRWFAVSGSMLIVAFVAACGNKGALYLEPDEQSLQELQQAKDEIEQAGQLPGDGAGLAAPSEGEDEESDDEDKPKKTPAS